MRTSHELHAETVKHVWQTLKRGGHLYLGTHSGWYCRSDEAFVPEAQLKDVPGELQVGPNGQLVPKKVRCIPYNRVDRTYHGWLRRQRNSDIL